MDQFNKSFGNFTPSIKITLNRATFLLSAIGLFADLLGIGKVVYDVVVTGNLSDLGFKIIVLVIVFFFGMGLGIASLKGFGNLSIIQMGKFYAWLYVSLTCLTYLGISFILRHNEYDLKTLGAFLLLIVSELLAVKAIELSLNRQIDTKQFSIPILSVCLIHALLVIYSYIFSGTKVSIFLGGDILFFTLMTFAGSSMLGDMAILKMIRRVFNEISSR